MACRSKEIQKVLLLSNPPAASLACHQACCEVSRAAIVRSCPSARLSPQLKKLPGLHVRPKQHLISSPLTCIYTVRSHHPKRLLAFHSKHQLSCCCRSLLQYEYSSSCSVHHKNVITGLVQAEGNVSSSGHTTISFILACSVVPQTCLKWGECQSYRAKPSIIIIESTLLSPAH